MLNPFSTGFKVTPKGTKSDHFTFNWKLAFPLLILFIFTAISLWSNLYAYILAAMHDSPEMAEQMRGLNLGWIWSIYNLVSLGVALLILLDVPKPDINEWFNLRRLIKLELKVANSKQTYWGVTTRISETGADISLTQAGIGKLITDETIPVDLSILEEDINLSGKITATDICEDFHIIHVDFATLTLEQERKLVALLFCRPGQWKRKNTPGELHSLWLLFKILLRPKVLFERNPKINGINVAQISS